MNKKSIDVIATIKEEINWIKITRKKFFWKNYLKDKKKLDFQLVYEELRKNIIALNKVVKQLERNKNLN